MNHKRGRRKDLRNGCLHCKTWKASGVKGSWHARTNQDKRHAQVGKDEREKDPRDE